MFCTITDVKNWTGYDVTAAIISQAQALIETYVGRSEVDVDNARDEELLGKATAYQAAYMKDNYARTFQQVAVSQLIQNQSVITFKAGDETSPWLAPLAKLACKNLSWRKSRAVQLGKALPPKQTPGWLYN
jgi:hypothetical protein